MNWSNEIEVFNEDNMKVMSRYPDNYFDLAVVDPPYRDMADNQPTKDMRNNGSMKNFGNKPTEKYFSELFRVSKNQIIWGANNFNLPNYKGFVIWKKKTIGENFTMSMAELAFISEGLGTTSKVIEMRPQQPNRIHPTQKPVALYKWLFLNYAKEGNKILDTHFGSGSIAIALDSVNKVEKMNLTLVGAETDEEYYQQSKERFDKATSQMSLF